MQNLNTNDLNLLKNQLRGQNLRNLLKRKGVTKYRLAKDCGITYRTIFNWQEGNVKPSDEYTIRVAKYLNLIKISEAEKLELKKEIEALQKRIQRLE